MKSLNWKIQRMRMMSPVEIGVRTGREVRNLLEYVLLTSGISPGSLGIEASRCGEDSGFPFGGKFYFDPRDELLRARLGSLGASCVKSADDALVHRVSVLGQTYDLGREIDWQYDYRLGRKCPNRYGSFIDVKNPDFEESIRWVWYLNRHKHLGALGRAYFVTQKREYAREILRQLCAWIEQNPPGMGVNWTAPLETALRLYSWLWAIFPLKDFGGFTPLVQKTVAQSIVLQTRHMFRNLSTLSSANNHLIAQGVTLFAVGTLFPGARDAGRWRDRGLSILWREILEQTYVDGVSKEHSLHYHCFVCELYAVALILAERNRVEIPGSVRERFSRMCDFLLSVSREDGETPAIGDSDDQTVVLPPDGKSLFDGLMACAGRVTGEAKFARSLGTIPVEAVFLLGGEGLERLQNTPRAASGQDRVGVTVESREGQDVRGSRAFSGGGYYVLSDTGEGMKTRCVVDCGELGLGKTAAHGHADCLSVTMTVNGKDVLVDPGTFTYHSRPEWRAYFRSTRAHNTISIDGQSQSEMLGPFVWGARATPRLEDVAMEDVFDLVAGSHDGYGRLSDPVEHKRVVVFVKPAFLIIADSLNAKGRHGYEQNFCLGGEASLSLDARVVRVMSGGTGPESLLFSPSLGRGIGTLLSGQETPIMGWRSKAFWQKEPCQCLSIKGEFEGRHVLETCVLNVGSGDFGNQVVSFSDVDPRGRAYSLVKRATPLCVETSLVNLSDGPAGERCLESDASFLCVREFSDGGALEIFGRKVGSVVRNGEVLVQAPEKLAFVKLRIEKETVRFEARGVSTVLVRAPRPESVVSSLPIVDRAREGDLVRISVMTENKKTDCRDPKLTKRHEGQEYWRS